MTCSEAIQAFSAIAQVILGGAIVYYAKRAKEIQTLQLEAATRPVVFLDVEAAGYVAEPDEPLNYLSITNKSSLPILEVTVTAEYIALIETTSKPSWERSDHLFQVASLGELAPSASALHCIDDVLDSGVDRLDLNNDVGHFNIKKTGYIRFYAGYRRRVDGVQLTQTRIVKIYTAPNIRPVAVYPSAVEIHNISALTSR